MKKIKIYDAGTHPAAADSIQAAIGMSNGGML